MLDQDAVICQCKCRQPETSTCADAKCPAGQLAVDLVRHVGELDAGSTAIGQKHCFSRFPLFGDVTYATLQRFRIKARILILKCCNVGRFAQQFEQSIVIALVPSLSHLANLLDGPRHDLKLKAVFRSVLNQRIARSKLQHPGDFLDPENRWTCIQPARCAQLWKEAKASFQCRFRGAVGQNEIDPKPVGHAVAHRLECAFCLLRFMRIERQPELAEPVGADLELAVDGLPNPSTAVVGAKSVLLDHGDAEVWFIHHQLAVGDENGEVHHRRLGPMLKALSNLFGVCEIDKVELAVLCRVARAHQTIFDPAVNELGHAVFDH